MTTIICDLSVDWMECPYCSMLNGCVESAESTCRAASERLDQAYADYREERDAGRAAIGTGQWSVWQDRLRYLEQQSTAAHDTWGNAIDEWADCIHTHRRLYEEQQREADAEPDRTDVLPETEGMSPVHEPDMFTLPPVATLYVTSCNPALRDWIMRLDHDTTPSDSPDHLTDAAHAEHTTHHDMPVDASQYIPVAVVKSILTKWETHYTGFRDFLAGRGLNPDGAGCAIFAIKEIRDDINKLTTTEEAPNA